jgi:predicted DNA-binding ArsR family transcriptional regulator
MTFNCAYSITDITDRNGVLTGYILTTSVSINNEPDQEDHIYYDRDKVDVLISDLKELNDVIFESFKTKSEETKNV